MLKLEVRGRIRKGTVKPRENDVLCIVDAHLDDTTETGREISREVQLVVTHDKMDGRMLFEDTQVVAIGRPRIYSCRAGSDCSWLTGLRCVVDRAEHRIEFR